MRLSLLLLLPSAFPAPLLAQSAPPRSVAPPAMQRWAPALAQDTDQVLFGDVWRRTELSPRDRSVVTVSALIATGKTPQLEGHLGRALDNGVSPAEIAGLVRHLAWYTGWPNAVSSLEVVDSVMRRRGINPSAARSSGDRSTPPSSDSTRAQMVRDTVAPTAPKLADLTNDALFEQVWRDPSLSPRDRSLVTIAALAAMGDVDQLNFHVRLAAENGLTRSEIAEAFTHLAFYAGWPKAMSAVAVLTPAPTPGRTATDRVRVIPAGSGRKDAGNEHFTGSVETDTSFEGDGGSRVSGARVSFAPGARTNWHRHPLGQLLIVTEGVGRVQDEGGPVSEIRAGDVVWTAPGVKHWHGSASGTTMSHVAVVENVPEREVEWLEPVTDAQYRARPS